MHARRGFNYTRTEREKLLRERFFDGFEICKRAKENFSSLYGGFLCLPRRFDARENIFTREKRRCLQRVCDAK